MSIWLYNSQFGCEYEYVEGEKHAHSNLSWTGRSRPVNPAVEIEPMKPIGPIVVPMSRVNYAELGRKILSVEPLSDKE